jgi:CRP-like cAMP-binding protein
MELKIGPAVAARRTMPDLRFSVSDGREFLARHDLLGRLTPEELDRLLAHARAERVDEGRVLFRKGDPGDRLYVVLAGRISISTTSEAGKEVVLNVLGRGEVFGEIALLDGKARTADAIAMAESHLLVLDRADFMPFLERHPEVSARVIAVLCERVRWISDSYEDALFLELPARLAKRLLVLAQYHGEPGDGTTTRIEFPLSQQELANLAGVSREAVNKLLRDWQSEGVIAHDKHHVTILDPARLKRLIEPA